MRIVRIGLGLAAGATFLALVLRNVDLETVGALVARAAPAPLLVAFAAFVVDFLLRAVRFWIMLEAATGNRLPLKPMIGPFVASFGVSDVLPLRVGDGFRVVWFNRRLGIPAGTMVGTMVVERILDLVTLVMLGGLALALARVDAPPAIVWNFQIALSLAPAAGIVLLFAPAFLCRMLERLFPRTSLAPLAWVIEALRGASAAVARIGSWRHLAVLTLMSLGLWLLESVVVVGAWLSLGGAAGDVLKPFLAFCFSTLGTLVPSLPGHFGAFEFFGLQAFALTGVDASLATAVLLVAHLILWAPTAVFGIVWLLVGAAEPARRAA